MKNQEALRGWVGRTVVIDLASPYVVLGQLAGWDDGYLRLTDADVHDLRESQTTREYYAVEARDHGIQVNRKSVLLRLDEVVCIAALEDVVS